MNNSIKVDNTVEDVHWNNWKNIDLLSFSKSNASCIPQNYYLLGYNYLPQMLLNVNNSLQNIPFNNNSENPCKNNDRADVSKLKQNQKIENSDDSNDNITNGANRFNENTLKYNPSMLLQIELNTTDPSLSVSNNTTNNLKTDIVTFNSQLENTEVNDQSKVKLPQLIHQYDINLKNYSKSNSEDKPTKCTACDKEFNDKYHLEIHMSVHAQRTKSRRCDYCDQTFPSKGKWYAHFKTHFNDPCFDCMFCNSSFVTEHYLEEHLKVHTEKRTIMDSVNFSIRTEDKNFLCTFCGKEFPDRPTVMFHLRIHTSDIIYRCMYCGKMFLNKSELNLHVRIHTGDKTHICGLCNKSFLTTSNLKQHFRIHTGDKPFCCTNCDKAFSNKSNLMQHVKVHTGEKPYRCKFCEKSFTTTSNLTQHLRTHTGVKPYVCQLCGKAFINNSNLSQHKKVHYSAGRKKEEIKKNPTCIDDNFKANVS